MKFEIAQIVIHNNNLENRHLVLATKEQDLNLDFLKSKKGIYYIKNIEKIATNNLTVINGFDYKIGRIIGNGNGYSIVGKFIDVFENDIQF